MSRPRIVFFGSGPVAAASLELLLPDFEIVAVITKPKPDHHHGSFPVLDVAGKHTLPLFTVSNKKELSDLITQKPFQADVAILIDFGIIVSRDVIDYFPRGIINSHFSLLPEWRGADPITFAILSGQKRTGVSLMLLVEAMDEGPVIACGVQELDGTETTQTLTKRLINLSDALLKEEVPRYLAGKNSGIPQQDLPNHMAGHPVKATYSRKLAKEDGILNPLQKSAAELEREIRAFTEWPKSRLQLAEFDVIITSASVLRSSGKPGSFTVQDKQLLLHCKEGSLLIERLKPAGKAEMTGSAFLAGYGAKLALNK